MGAKGGHGWEAADDWSGWSVSMPDIIPLPLGLNIMTETEWMLAMCAFTAGAGAHGCKRVRTNGEVTRDYSGWSVSCPTTIPWLLGL